MRKVYPLLFTLQLFVGIGAIAGGLAAITNPQYPLGIRVEVLKYSPFSNYLIPGIILFTVIGLGNVYSAIMFHFKLKFQGYISSVFSWALVIWIVVQCIMFKDVAFLHVLFFIIGLIEVGLSTTILYEQQLFPSNLIRNFYEVIRKKKLNFAKLNILDYSFLILHLLIVFNFVYHFLIYLNHVWFIRV